MKVLLKKEGYFEFDETKFTKIPNDVFNAMAIASFDNVEAINKNIPEVLYFKNMKEYMVHYSNGKFALDKRKDIFVSQKGEVFVYLNTDIKSGSVSVATTKEETDVTANTEKNTTSKA